MIRVNENTYKSHEGGLRRKGALPLDDAKNYAKRFEVDLGWLLTGQGSPFPQEAKAKNDTIKVAAPSSRRRVA
jgi:hypothetical protein